MSIPFFKTPRVNAKVRRGLQRRARTNVLDAKKDIVRRRDKWCRVPLCGCRKFRLQLHVSHSTHQGMGGDPKGLRSDPETMILVCAARHREHAISIDKGTLKPEPLTAAGTDGPIRWLIPVEWLVQEPAGKKRWRDVVFPALKAAHLEDDFEVARETAIGQWEPFTPAQRMILEHMETMTV